MMLEKGQKKKFFSTFSLFRDPIGRPGFLRGITDLQSISFFLHLSQQLEFASLLSHFLCNLLQVSHAVELFVGFLNTSCCKLGFNWFKSSCCEFIILQEKKIFFCKKSIEVANSSFEKYGNFLSQINLL